jgi:3-methyl-2-oxobutanoate hydroxymethyltransferase
MSSEFTTKQITIPWIRAQKGVQRLTMLTAYDYPTAAMMDEAGVEMLLVGDSVGTVVYGAPNTLGVTMEEILRHTKAVTSATKRALVVADMPFMSYQVSVEEAVRNAGRFLKESGAQAVKLEGGMEIAPIIEKITRAGIPVMAHIGLTPQSLHAMGQYRMYGKSQAEQEYLLDSARAVESAGAFAVVLECVEAKLSALITKHLKIPTIGIGAGDACDGQVLVFHDLVGLTAGRVPKFVRPTAQLKPIIIGAVKAYIERTKETLDSSLLPKSESDPIGGSGLTTKDIMSPSGGLSGSSTGI